MTEVKNKWELWWGEEGGNCFWLRSQIFRHSCSRGMCFGTVCLSTFLTVRVFVGVCHIAENIKWSLVCNFIDFCVDVLASLKVELKKITTYNYRFRLSETFFLACKELNLTGGAGTTWRRILYCLLLPVNICSSQVSSTSKCLKSTMDCLALFPLSCVLLCFILGFMICSCSKETQLLD